MTFRRPSPQGAELVATTAVEIAKVEKRMMSMLLVAAMLQRISAEGAGFITTSKRPF
jgi:hypothetical protein